MSVSLIFIMRNHKSASSIHIIPPIIGIRIVDSARLVPYPLLFNLK